MLLSDFHEYMTSQFKTFLKFALLAAAIIALFLITNAFGIDLLEWLGIPLFVFFVGLVWYRLFHRVPKPDAFKLETPGVQVGYSVSAEQLSYGWIRQLISALIISVLTFLGFLYLSFFVLPFFYIFYVFSFPILRYSIRIFALVLFLYSIVRWIQAIIYSIRVRRDAEARKKANKKIILAMMFIFIFAYIIISTFSLFDQFIGIGVLDILMP